MMTGKMKYLILILLFFSLLTVLEYCFLTCVAVISLFFEFFGIILFWQWQTAIYYCIVPALIANIFIYWWFLEYYFVTDSTIPFKFWEQYCDDLAAYMMTNEYAKTLENSNIQVYMNNFGMGLRIRILNKKNNKMLELSPYTLGKSGLELLSTVWGIIQMNFNDKITYRGLYAWCRHICGGKFMISKYK